MFELFDPDQETIVEEGRLPHWYQPGITYFITFRTADSVPLQLANDWQARRVAWLRERGFPASIVPEKLPTAIRRDFHRIFSAEFLEYLDRGYGECVLRKPELAKIVMESLLHFDGDRYVVSDAVVMPNHVHVLVGMNGSTTSKKQCRSWKHYTAVKINEALGREDEFWQTESFDHAVRTPAAFGGFQRYIWENPEKAGLKGGEYLLYSSGCGATELQETVVRLLRNRTDALSASMGRTQSNGRIRPFAEQPDYRPASKKRDIVNHGQNLQCPVFISVFISSGPSDRSSRRRRLFRRGCRTSMAHGTASSAHKV